MNNLRKISRNPSNSDTTFECKETNTQVIDLCTANGGKFCLFNINLQQDSTPVVATLEVCIPDPSQCTDEQLKDQQAHLVSRFTELFASCQSDQECTDIRYQLNCDHPIDPTETSGGTSKLVFGLILAAVVLGFLGLSGWYIYKKMQENPDESFTDLIKGMPPMKAGREFFRPLLGNSDDSDHPEDKPQKEEPSDSSSSDALSAVKTGSSKDFF